jgi:hypothetical protein
MKKIYLLLSLILIIFSCSKNEINDAESSLNYRSRTDIFSKLGIAQNDVIVNNGILKFKDQNTLNTIRQNLEILRNDTAFITEYLSSLGFTDADEESEAYPWEPALAYFASYFNGFNPLGKAEELREKQFLINGGDPVDFNDHFINNEIWQYLFNDKLEIQVGDKILKKIDNHNQLVILNSDMNSVNLLRNNPDVYLSQIIENTFLINDKVWEDVALYKRLTNERDDEYFNPRWDPTDCSVEIKTISFGNDKYRFVALAYNQNIVNYKWKIYNSSNLLVYQANGPKLSIDVTLPPTYAYYTVVVEASSADNSCVATDEEVVTITDCNCNFDFILNNPDIHMNGAAHLDHYWIRLTGLNYTCNYDVTVNWGDGTTNTYQNVSQNTIIEHDYIINTNPNSIPNGVKSYNVCVFVRNTTTHCNKSLCKNIDVGCGSKVPDIYGWKVYSSSPQQKFYYELEMDYKNLFEAQTTIRAIAKNYVHKYGKWWTAKADKIEYKFSICRPTYNCSEYGNPYPLEGSELNKSKLSHDIWSVSTSEVTVKPNYVSGDFYVTDLGQKFGPYNLHW